MMNSQKKDNASCLSGLKPFELGQEFNLWIIHFYNEMVERKYHHYFPYNKRTRAYTASVKVEGRIEIIKEAPDEQKTTKAKYIKEYTLAQSFLERCVTAETVQ